VKTASIIIPNMNSRLIGPILRRLQRQIPDAAQLEILVVGIDEPRLVSEDHLVRFIRTHRCASAAVNRNIGIQTARGEILMFLDDDCVPAYDWVERHLAQHREGKQIVGGSVTFGSDHYLQLADNVSAFHDFLPFLRAGTREYLLAGNLSVDRSVIDRAGPLDERLRRAEDLEWTARFRLLGYVLHFDPRALVYHDPARFSFPDVWRHWSTDAHDTLSVRLHYKRVLRTAWLARYRWLFVWAFPLVAAWATARSFGHHRTLWHYWHTLPMVYVTKVAWCLGAAWHFPDLNRSVASLPEKS
jgi:glycosyltransferase involved in cell wall biosynthesis